MLLEVPVMLLPPSTTELFPVTLLHIPFIIDEKARRAWLGCYKKALEKSNIPEPENKMIWDFLVDFSSWMVNTKE